ncbi:MAG: hypothetical protein JSR33_10530 [Proteobacteria bacterium]|nr:hypothetical protein [Pseudomonadota bacterium]
MEIQDQQRENYNTVLSNLRHFSEIKVLNNTGIEFRNRPARIILDTSLGVHHILNQMLRTSLDNLNLPIKLIRTKKQTKLELKETSISGDLNLGIIKLKNNKLDFDIFQKSPLFVLSSTLDVGLGELIGAVQLGIHPLKLQGNFSLKESAFMLLGLKIYGLAASLQMNQGLMLGVLAKFSIQEETKLSQSEDGDIKAQIDQTGIITQFNAVLPENKTADLETLVKCLIPIDQRDSQFESAISNIKKVFPTSLGPIEDKAFLEPLTEKSSTDATIRELLSEAKKLVIKFERGSGGLLDWQLKFLGQFNTFGLCAFLMLDVAIKSGVRLIGGAKKTDLFGGLIKFGKMITPMDYKPPINIEGPAIYLNMRYGDLQNFRFYINSSITLLGLTSESLIDVSTEGLSFDFKFNCRLSWYHLEEKTTVKLDSNGFHFNAHPKINLTIDIAGQSIPLIGMGMGLFVRYSHGSMNIVVEVDIPGTSSTLRLPSILCSGTNFTDILSTLYQPIFEAVKSTLVSLPQEKLKAVFEHIPQLAGQAVDIAQKIHQGTVFVVTEVVTQRFVQPIEQTASLIASTGQALNPLRLLSPPTPSIGTDTSSSSSTSSTSTSVLKALTGGWW